MNIIETPYDDIMNLPRPKSHFAKASIESRAAQFAPYSALDTFGEIIDKTTFLMDLYKKL